MIAYNSATLKNIFINSQAKEAAKSKLITAEEVAAIEEAHPIDLYMPSFFVGIGLGILTFFITICSAGLCLLIFSLNSGLSFFLFLLGAVSYAVLEYMVTQKRHYNSGVDNVLMITTAIFIISGISFNINSNIELLFYFLFLLFFVCFL